jgi:hypothetical protein
MRKVFNLSQYKKLVVFFSIFFILSAKADPVLVSEQPWGSIDDATAMNEVFGVNNWINYSTYADANTNFNSIFTTNTPFVYLQGGAQYDSTLVNFLSTGANNSSILDWVSNGGRILMESAGWSTDVSLAGVTLVNGSYISTGGLTQAGIETFTNYPIVNLNRNGNALAHNYIVADPGIQLITFIEGAKDSDNSIVPIVSGFQYGSGYIMFSGLTLYRWHCSVNVGASCRTQNGLNFNLASDADGTSWLNNMITTFSNPVALAFAYSFIYGPSSFDTQSSMQYQASQLRSAFNSQTVAANFALNYDCNIFDVKGMCISAGGRYTTIDNPGINNSAAVVTLGYKVNPNIRMGAYLDQNINISKPTGIDISNNTPLMGLYAVWNKEQSGLGYQVRLANTYQDKDVTQTRTVFDTSEAGSGKSSLTSQSYLAELSYAFQYQDKTLVRPYAGLRYTHLKQKGYTEDTTDTVTDPLTVAALRDKGITALLGVKVNRSLTDKATLTAQLGFEQDVHHNVGNYSATDLNGSDLTAIAFNSNIKRTRPVASIGTFYDVTKTQRASATINYQQLPFQSTGSTTAYFNYMIGF